MLARIGTVTIYVEDQNKALEFWTKKMGFELRRNEPMAEGTGGGMAAAPGLNWIEVAPEEAETRLLLYPKSLMNGGAVCKPSLVFECRNIEKYFELLKARDVEITAEPKKKPGGIFGTFKDIDGNEFTIKE